MPLLTGAFLLLLVAIFVNDALVAGKVRKAVERGHLPGEAFACYRAAGSPLGIVFNLFRMPPLPAADDLGDPDVALIRLLRRVQQVLVGLLAAVLAVPLLLALV